MAADLVNLLGALDAPGGHFSLSALLRTEVSASRSVLVTRHEGEAGRVSARLVSMGFSPILAPLFTVEPRRTPSLPEHVQAILVTSGNALPSLAPSHLPLLAVGDTTAQRARQVGFTRVHSAGADAVALAALATELLDPAAGPVLLATGAGQGTALAADLRQRGFRVIRRVCYGVRPVRRFPPQAAAALAAGQLHAALFLSAETASIFVRLLPPECRDDLASVRALAIGRSTAEALESLPWLRICRAPAPTLDDVLALL